MIWNMEYAVCLDDLVAEGMLTQCLMLMTSWSASARSHMDCSMFSPWPCSKAASLSLPPALASPFLIAL